MLHETLQPSLFMLTNGEMWKQLNQCQRIGNLKFSPEDIQIQKYSSLFLHIWWGSDSTVSLQHGETWMVSAFCIPNS